jgi:hypothetical protein
VLATDLSTILPVNFVAVVFLWIVRCRHHDSSHTLVMQDSERYKWRRA